MLPASAAAKMDIFFPPASLSIQTIFRENLRAYTILHKMTHQGKCFPAFYKNFSNSSARQNAAGKTRLATGRHVMSASGIASPLYKNGTSPHPGRP